MRRMLQPPALAAAMCVAAAVAAGEAGAQGGLTLLATKITSKSNDLPLTTSPQNAFDAVTLECPGPELCTLRIEFSSQFVKTNAPIEARINVNGVAQGVKPRSTLWLLSGTPEGLVTSTFTVWRPDLPPGSHTVRVRFVALEVPGGTEGGASLRTLTVQMFAQ